MRSKMATKLFNSERLIINQLIDTGLFANSMKSFSKEMAEATESLKKTIVQQKVNNYLHDLIGIYPESIQEILLLLIGSEFESPETVHVLLATLKAVINLPELQDERTDRDVLTQTIVRQVHSEVTDLDEREIHRLITTLFVDRFKLFTLDHPEFIDSEHNQEISEYWNVDPNFNLIAQGIVDQLTSKNNIVLNDTQRVNRALLIHRYISAKRSPYLWDILLNKKDKIAEQWDNLDRFYLECGDGYALLLDKKRQQVKSKPAVVAIEVAHRIHSGISESELNQEIKVIAKEFFPNSNIGLSLVKDALNDFGLINIRNGFVFPTPIIARFVSKKQSVEEH